MANLIFRFVPHSFLEICQEKNKKIILFAINNFSILPIYGIIVLLVIVKKQLAMQVYGIDAIIRIVSHLAFIYLAFWSLRSLRIETFFRAMHNTQIRMTIVLFSIFLGYTASNFFLEIIALCRNLFVSLLF